jgi:hypothetical protein
MALHLAAHAAASVGPAAKETLDQQVGARPVCSAARGPRAPGSACDGVATLAARA